MKDVIIYTAIFNGKDTLKEPTLVSDRCKYICFTDDENLKSNVWEIRVVDPGYGDGNLNAKYFKIFPHKCLNEDNVENSIWVDGARQIIGDINWFIKNVANDFNFNGVLLLKHPEGRDCLFQEIEHILLLNRGGNIKSPNDIILNQKNIYKDDGMPKNFGLFNCPILIRNHNDKDTTLLSDAWWVEILNKSKRDQVSLPYTLWKNNIKHNTIPLEKFNADNNTIFKWYPHIN